MPEVHLTEEGRYRGRLQAWKVNRANNGGICFTAKALCTQRQDVTKSFVPMEVPATCMAFCTLVTGEGRVNQKQADSLKASLGWDGRSLKALNGGDYKDLDLEFVATASEDGRIKIDWINAPGGLKPTAPETLDELDGEWAGKADAPAEKAPAGDCPF